MTNTILIDHRERNIEIIKEFEKDKIPFEITSLYNADFVISNIGIERKTKYDFLTSIIDKRLILQLKGLKEYFFLTQFSSVNYFKPSCYNPPI